MGPPTKQKPGKAPAIALPPDESVVLEGAANDVTPKPTEAVRLVGLVQLPHGLLRVVTMDVPVTDVEVLAARLPSENALERAYHELRGIYARLTIRRTVRP